MKPIFLSLVYSFIRLIGLTLLIGCGSVQTINGVRIPTRQKEVPKKEILAGFVLFGAGYYIQKEHNVVKKN